MEKNVIFFWFEFKKEKNNFSAINYIISLINYILNAKSLFKQKNINSLLALLIASFFDKKIISFPFVNEIIEYLQNLVIPIINLIINNSEKQVNQLLFTMTTKETMIISMKMQMIWLMKEIIKKLFHLLWQIKMIKIN